MRQKKRGRTTAGHEQDCNILTQAAFTKKKEKKEKKKKEKKKKKKKAEYFSSPPLDGCVSLTDHNKSGALVKKNRK